MHCKAAPWIKKAACVGCRPLAVLIAKRLTWQSQIIAIPLTTLHATLSPKIAQLMLKRMQAAGLLAYRIRSQWIEIAACTEYDVF